MRQWKRNTKEMTSSQIRTKFHKFDKNGNGRLDSKEFRRLLKSFGIEMHQLQVNSLIDRFDKDGDGNIDMSEFFTFGNLFVNCNYLVCIVSFLCLRLYLYCTISSLRILLHVLFFIS